MLLPCASNITDLRNNLLSFSLYILRFPTARPAPSGSPGTASSSSRPTGAGRVPRTSSPSPASTSRLPAPNSPTTGPTTTTPSPCAGRRPSTTSSASATATWSWWTSRSTTRTTSRASTSWSASTHEDGASVLTVLNNILWQQEDLYLFLAINDV